MIAIKLAVLASILAACGSDPSLEEEEPRKKDQPSPSIPQGIPPSIPPSIPSGKIPDPSTPSPALPSDSLLRASVLRIEGVLGRVLGGSYKIKTTIVLVDQFESPSVLARCIRRVGDQFHPSNKIEVAKKTLQVDQRLLDRWLDLILLHEVAHCDFLLDHSLEAHTERGTEQREVVAGLGRVFFPLQRSSLMWPSIALSETESLHQRLDLFAREIVDQKFEWERVDEKFQYSLNNFPRLENLYRWRSEDGGSGFQYRGDFSLLGEGEASEDLAHRCLDTSSAL